MVAETLVMGRRKPIAPPTWARDDLIARLAWQYGPERAARIIAGLDVGTLIDIARWRLLGTGRRH